MKKIRQILAILGIILLGGLYLTTLVMAVIDNTNTMQMFHACVYATVIIPVLLWAYSFIYKLIKGSSRDDSPADSALPEETQEPEELP